MEAQGSCLLQEHLPQRSHPHSQTPDPHPPIGADAVATLAHPVLTALTFRIFFFTFLATGFEVGCLHFHDNNYYQLFVYCCIPFLMQDPIIFMKTSVSESIRELYQRSLKMVSQDIIIII